MTTLDDEIRIREAVRTVHLRRAAVVTVPLADSLCDRCDEPASDARVEHAPRSTPIVVRLCVPCAAPAREVSA
jgi:hypothetical protein